MGVIVGVVTYLITTLTGVTFYIAAGGAIGLLVGTVPMLTSGSLRGASAQVPTPLGQATFQLDDRTRRVAWQLFIEIMTRVTTQPLGPEQGFLREALASLYNLFGTTRGLLKEMDPTQVTEGETVEMLAIAMLNRELRPFLSKWHPLLTAFEEIEPKRPNWEWDMNEQFRAELESLRQQLIRYARSFGEIARVSQLEQLITESSYST